nr:MAG TPA: hypothetical protein [Bacteriophage sp.]DAT87530.1 MAG TPA: hypothetical protein [Caudoviricetes sp.]DAU62759.1 MAG TPA: hypothetical protein [Caudoviricetes sp.]
MIPDLDTKFNRTTKYIVENEAPILLGLLFIRRLQ